MSTLYLMRHGQTEFNLGRLVQGHCDSPLTALGAEQARKGAAWLRGHGIAPARVASSPLGRARRTLDIVVEEMPSLRSVPRTDEEGLIERCYGSFEGGPMDALPRSPWDPGDSCVPFGGDSEASARDRIVSTLTRLMREARGGDVLAVSHGSITTLFKKAWGDRARCDQDVKLGNCCILEFEFDPDHETFSNTRIVNPA